MLKKIVWMVWMVIGIYVAGIGTPLAAWAADDGTAPSAPYYRPMGDSRAPVGEDARYSRTYGRRYSPSYRGWTGMPGYPQTYYQPQGMLFRMIGALMGVAMGSGFGIIGTVIGGMAGYWLGGKLADILHPGYPYGYPQRVGSGPAIAGLMGAAMGALMASGAGMVWMIAGGLAGYYVGRLVARVLFPQLYYGGVFYPVYRQTGGVQYPYSGYNPYSTYPQIYRPKYPSSPTTSAAEDIEELKAKYEKALADYRNTLRTGDIEKITMAREAYKEAERAYWEAKSAAMR